MHNQDYSYRYQGGSLEANDPTYVWRPADDQLYQQLRLGEFCYVLTARQMGKSSLRVQTMNRLQQEGIACANIDLAAIGSQATPEQWYKGILFRLFRSFQLSGQVNWRTWWRDRSFLPVVQRLGEVIEGVLLTSISQNVVIFIDEIDSVISIDFPTDDFFAFIRACYNQRADDSRYKRLTFCLLGVATPSDLIQDKRRTPFNIGHAIELTGLTLDKAKSRLSQGLVGRVNHPEQVLANILTWTGGQPFLTQKLCQLVVEKASSPNPDIETIIQTNILDNWEVQDEPEHLRTIRDRILYNKQRAVILLARYQAIFRHGKVETNNNTDDIELQLSGLITKKDRKLKISNKIYQQVFNQSWIDSQLGSLWFMSQDLGEIEEPVTSLPSRKYFIKVIAFSSLLTLLGAISLFLVYQVFPSTAWQNEYHEHAEIIEFIRLLIVVVGVTYLVYFVWKKETTEIIQSQSQKAKLFHYAAIGFSILTLYIVLRHNIDDGPIELQEKYGDNPETNFQEYYLPSILYLPYSLILHLLIGVPFGIVSIYAATGTLTDNFQEVKRIRKKARELVNNSLISKELKQISIKKLFARYIFKFINIISPYTNLFLGAGVIHFFETEYGRQTLTEVGQEMVSLHYVLSFSAILIILGGFAQYQKAFKETSQHLFRLDADYSKFIAENNILVLLRRIIVSNVNLILLIVLLLLNFIPRLQ
ncbi:MAG: AAA-like domain-containing protein [Coleofasciculaceae cyanobacterium]